MTTKTIHTLKVQVDDLKRNLLQNFICLLHDEKDEDVDVIESDVNRLSDCLNWINKSKASYAFAEGYTMMLLNPKDFDEVEHYFNNLQTENSSLEIVIVAENGNTLEVVHEESVAY